MSFLDILGSAAISGGEKVREGRQREDQRRAEEERKRKERFDMLAKYMGMVDDPALKAKMFQGFQGGGDINTLFSDIIGKQAQMSQAQQRAETQQQEAENTLDTFVDSNTGATARGFSGGSDVLSEQDARRLGTMAQSGNGLQGLMQMRGDIEQGYKAELSKQQEQQRNVLMNKVGALKDKDAAISLRNQAKALGAEDIVGIIDQRIEQGFGDGGSSSGGSGSSLGKADQTKVNQINSMDAKLKNAQALLADPSVRETLGPGKGLWNRSIQNNPSVQLLTGRPPLEFSVFQSDLVDLADQFLRLRTGAAAQDAEIQRIMNQIVGDVTLDPETLGVMLSAFQNSLEIERQAIQSGEAIEVDPMRALQELERIVKSAEGQAQPQTSDDYQDATDEDLDAELRRRGLAQ